MEDTQLSLAIGKKGQNVRLAAKLLGWKVDIKSEEEKRQEVESAMAALVNPPEPVSALIAYGLGEELAARLAEGGVGTIEKLGGMTPEQLQEIPGIDPEMVESIRDSVTGYYGQFEEAAPAAEDEAAAEAAAETEAEIPEGEPLAAEGVPEPEVEAAAEPAAESEMETAGAVEAGEPQDIEIAGESDTIIDSGRVSHGESEDSGS